MSKRGVISVIPADLGDGSIRHFFKVEEAFDAIVTGRQNELTCRPTDSEFKAVGPTPSQDAVRKAGQKLFGVLSSNTGVKDMFALMNVGLNHVASTGASNTYPLYVKIDDAPDAESLPWEVLWEQNRNFLCLDPNGRWPVARMTSGTTRAEPIFRTIEPALRVAIVLAAVRESGADEWECFQRALGTLILPIEVLVLTSEDTALQRIRTDVAGWPATRSGTVDFVADSKTLMEQIITFGPNILHFFCHGVAESVPQLELETRSDRRARPPSDHGSITLDAQLLAGIVTLRSLWLIVLNCCRGGKPALNLHSMAKTLVTDRVPAVVAMRESIEVSDANLFTEYFYTSLLKQLIPVYALRAGAVATKKAIPFPELAWMRATDNARRQLSSALGRAAVTDSQWTYPVLYVHRDELNLEPRSSSTSALTPERKTEIVVELEIMRRMHESIRPGVDPSTDATRREFERRIQELEEQLVS